MLLWPVLGVILLGVLFCLWWDLRRDYRAFQKMYRIRLPHLAHVTLVREDDKVMWGYRRWRFVRADGGKDRRKALNIKITYPTVIVVNRFKVYILNMREAKRVFRRASDYMLLPLSDCPSNMEPHEDLWRFFRGRKVRFVRYVANLFFRYGWMAELIYDQPFNILVNRNNKYYVCYCFFSNRQTVLNEVSQIPKMAQGVYPVAITNTRFSSGAQQYAKENGILLMDKRRINLSFEVGCIMFIGREG